MAQSMIDTLVCPIGVDGISGKKPAEIAVATAAEILKLRDQATQTVTGEFPHNVHPLRK
jgi:xanthine/CO dehydrogenase XdhC/CoxF family maturation factor